MTYFLKAGNSYRVTPKENLDLTEHLPGGNYTVKKDPHGNLYLEKIDDFEIKGKIYGNTLRHADRIMQTFLSRPAATGVMLAGEKGSGKTLLSKQIAANAAAQDIPTIVINAPWCGDDFNSFMQLITQPCVILFDEFEKVYDRDDQEKILTLLDGTFPSRKLFMLTCNDKWRVDSHMRNRPGRIFYMMDFKGLDADFIREYCADNLKATEHTERIVKIGSLFSQFNFDMLKALIEEMNRYGETPAEALEMLNVKPEFSDGIMYDVQVWHNGLLVERDKLHTKVWKGNPLAAEELEISYNVQDPTDPEESNWANAEFTQDHLRTMDANSGSFVFSNEDGARLVLTRTKERSSFNYNAL